MPTRHRLAPAVAAALALLAAGAAIPASAQSSDGGAAGTYDDGKLAAVAEVMTEIREVRADYTVRIERTDDPEERQSLVQEGNRKLATVVEDHPEVRAEELNEILAAASEDPQLAERLDAEMRRAAE